MVSLPSGLIVAFSVASVGSTPVAQVVMSAGGIVVKVWSGPVVVPTLLVATTR